jgi:WD40 repeat protein
LWNFETGACTRTFSGHKSGVTCLAVILDCERFLSGSLDKTILLWTFDSCKHLVAYTGFHADAVSCLVVVDSGRFVSGSADSTLALWSLEDSKQAQPIRSFRGHSRPVTCAVVSSHGDLLYSGSQDNSIRIWDISTGQLLNLWEKVYSTGCVCSLSLNNSFMVSSGGESSAHTRWNAIKMWQQSSVANDKPVLTIYSDTGVISSVAVTVDGKRLLSSSGDKGVRMWDAVTGEQLVSDKTAHSSMVYDVAVSVDGSFAASCSHDKTICLWELSSVALRKLGSLRGHSGAVLAVAFLQ